MSNAALQKSDRLVVGVDVGRFSSQLCILARETDAVRQERIGTSVEEFTKALAPIRASIDALVIEASPQSLHIGRELRKLGFAVVLVDPRKAAPFLRTYRQAKTDRNDAFGLAKLFAHGAERIVWLRSEKASELRAMLATRDPLIKAEVGLRNAIGSHLAAVGLTVRSASRAKHLRLLAERLKELRGVLVSWENTLVA